MTVEITADPDPSEIDLHGLVDESKGVRYIGKAKRGFDGRWTCLADVCGSLCWVEVTVRPTVHVASDPGDEDDQLARKVRYDRDMPPGRRR